MGWRNQGLYPLWVQEFKAEFHSLHGREPSKDEIAEAYERLGSWRNGAIGPRIVRFLNQDIQTTKCCTFLQTMTRRLEMHKEGEAGVDEDSPW
jgi:hypothetical protein